MLIGMTIDLNGTVISNLTVMSDGIIWRDMTVSDIDL